MVIRTFLDKCNTIKRDSDDNFGLNPVIMLNYGKTLSRALIHFDVDSLSEKLSEAYTGEFNAVKHVLKMRNCGSVDEKNFHKSIKSNDDSMIKYRTNSFDVYLAKVNDEWDEGVGFDNGNDFWFTGRNANSTNGSNWYQSKNGYDWEYDGVYTTNYLEKECAKFSNGEESIIVGRQHFDHGNEDLEIDLTDYVNSMLSSGNTSENKGLILFFDPLLEDIGIKYSQYVGFFSNNTNTFFEPYVETSFDSKISDDRHYFCIGKKNKLYLYANIDGNPVDLDVNPTCVIDDDKYTSNRVRKGVYCADIMLSSGHTEDEVLSDVWTNIIYDGEMLDDVENEFVTKSNKQFFNFSYTPSVDRQYTCTVLGVATDENVIKNDIIEMKVLFRERYNKYEYISVNNAEYRLYVMDGDKEYDVINWDCIDRIDKYNTFRLNTSELLPNEYFIDVRVRLNGLLKTFKRTLRFKIVNNNSEQKL